MIERNKWATNNTTDSRKLTNMFRLNRSLTTQTFNKEVFTQGVHILFSGAKKGKTVVFLTRSDILGHTISVFFYTDQ